MRKLRSEISILLVIICALAPMRADIAHAAGYESPPSNVSNLENSLSDSIGVFKCSSGTGLGFIGNYIVTPEAKSKGINSYFVTSFQNLLNCRFATWDSITATYRSETAVGQMLVNNGDATE